MNYHIKNNKLINENERLNWNIKCVIDNIKTEVKIIKNFNTETIEKDYMIGFLNVCIKVLQDIKGENNGRKRKDR